MAAASRIGGVILLVAFVCTTVLGSSLNTQEGDVRLVGGDSGVEGRAQIYHDDEWNNICFSAGDEHEWEFPEGDTFCKQLGFTSGAALIVDGEKTAEEYGIGSGDTYLTNVDCVEDTDNGLLGCDNVQWGSSCQNGLGLAGVVCRLPGFVGCYLYLGSGFLNQHHVIGIPSEMTLDKCLDACYRTPGVTIKYAGLVQKQDENGDIIASCNCGDSNSVIPSGSRLEDHDCYELCPGDDTQTCGAYMRAAVYDFENLRVRDPLLPSRHIIWPNLGREYSSNDNGAIYRVTLNRETTGYTYAVLHVLAIDLASGDSVTLRSDSRSGTTLSSTTNINPPYRWNSLTTTRFEVQTRVVSTSQGGAGFIIYYEFGRHCDASDLPDVIGGSWDAIRGGYYYQYECPNPFCQSGYEPSSLAVCQLDGTWMGVASCSEKPATRPTLFPPVDPQTLPPRPPADNPSTTLAPESTTPPPITTQPQPITPPPPTQPPPPQPQTTQPQPPESTRPSTTQEPPPPRCILPQLPPYSEFIPSGRVEFYEGESVNHCCVHNVYDENCLVLTCQSSGRWGNEEYLRRCEPTVCHVPVTNSYGSLNGMDGRSYFLYGDEISLCCTSSDYCYVLQCRSDGSWYNGDQLLGCPVPRPPQPKEDNKMPIWVIAVLIAAAVIGLVLVLLCLCVFFLRPRRRYHNDRRLIRQRNSKERPARFIEPRDGHRYPPPPAHLHDNDYKPQQKSSHAHPSKDPRDYSHYAKYGARPMQRAPDYGAHPLQREPDYNFQPRRQPSHHTDRQSERSRPRTDADEASALGALNNAVQDFERSASNNSFDLYQGRK